MKNLKKALLSTAVLAGLAAGNVYAGTEACFETFKGADNLALTNADIHPFYGNASCTTAAALAAQVPPVVGTAATALMKQDTAKIAYELTGGTNGLDVNFDAVNGVDTDLQIVYVPTTDIPPGTLIEFTITNATFKGNANQLHLVKDSDAGIAVSALDTFTAVASSDGAFDGAADGKIKFITKAGITIGAGTRLVFSKVSSGATAADIVPASFNVKNTECTGAQQKFVTIAATKAVTDGGTGYSIDGAVSKAHNLMDISAQLAAFIGSATVNGQVNAESKDFAGNTIVARTEFVYTAANGATLRKAELVHKAGFANRAALLDQAVALNADDLVELSFVETADAGASVKAGLYNNLTLAGGTNAPINPIDLNGAAAGTFLDFVASKPTTAQVGLPANVVFAADAGTEVLETAPPAYAGAAYNEHFFTVSQTDLTKIMNFNYDVNVHALINFKDSELDHCAVEKNTHKVGVNGAVLKVPYTVNGAGNFVRVTNEHTVAAEVTVDLFSESTDGNTGNRAVTAVKLANVPAKSSIVYFVPDVVAAAIAQKNYEGSADVTTGGAPLRHTMTFTVTSPKNTVHGVSVQKLSTGSDRVMPVLDQNEWSQ